MASLHPDADNCRMATLIQQFEQEKSRFLPKPLLTTEAPHPQTLGLSELAINKPAQAITRLIEVDRMACQALEPYEDQLAAWSACLHAALQKKRRLFIIGCGSSGRLAVLLETLAKTTPGFDYPHQIKGVIAGGDVALVRAIENAEDDATCAKAQLLLQGFTKNDVLVGLSASGQASFIHGALAFAADFSDHPSWLLCNNPLTLLTADEKTHHVLAHPNIRPICLDVGPMALTGSTRMQATTAMMLALGHALFSTKTLHTYLEPLTTALDKVNVDTLADISHQSFLGMHANRPLRYQCDARHALSVLTDLTEQAPTFNSAPLPHPLDASSTQHGPTLTISNTKHAQDAWQQILMRKPVCLNNPAITQTHTAFIAGFDFSSHALMKMDNPTLTVTTTSTALTLTIGSHILNTARMPHPLLDQALLKLLLNIHSTVMMGKMGAYEGNMMTSLYPSNIKLMARAIRYIKTMATLKLNKTISDTQAEKALVSALPGLARRESIVIKSLDYL